MKIWIKYFIIFLVIQSALYGIIWVGIPVDFEIVFEGFMLVYYPIVLAAIWISGETGWGVIGVAAYWGIPIGIIAYSVLIATIFWRWSKREKNLKDKIKQVLERDIQQPDAANPRQADAGSDS